MTRYVVTPNLLASSSDPDGDAFIPSHLSMNAGSTPALIDWVATPVVIFSSWTGRVAGQIEIRKDGSIIYDDLGNSASHPPSGNLPTITIRFRTTDARGAVSTGIGTYTLTLTAATPADVTAPTIVSVAPATGAALVQVFEFVCSEAIQMGSGNIVLWDVAAGSAVETITLPGAFANPVAPGKVFVQGSSFFVQPTSALTAGKQYSWRPAAGFVKDLSGNNLAAITDDSIAIRVAGAAGSAFPDDPYGFRGRTNTNYGTTMGTDFDILVDPVGSGTNIYTTLALANAAAVSGKTIAIKAGTYREQITLKTGVTYQAYGTDRPLLSAQTAPLTGWTQCGAGDSGVLGSVLGVASSPVYKKTGLLKSTFPISDLFGLNVFEGLVPLGNAQDRPDKTHPFDREDEETYNDPVTNGGNFYNSGVVAGSKGAFNEIVDPAILTAARYTDAQLLAARLWVFAEPNEIYKRTITASNVATNKITVSGGDLVNNDGRKRYSLGNVGPAMVAGTWIFVDGGGSTFDLYVYPTNPANINTVTYATRLRIMDFGTTGVTNVAIKGLDFLCGTGSADGDGSAIVDNHNGSTTSNTLIENVHCIGSENIGQLHYAAIKLNKSDTNTIQFSTFEYCGAHGIWPTGSTGVNNDVLIRMNVFSNCGSAGAKAYSTNTYAFINNYHFHCGFRAHGNLGNVYLGGVDSIWFANMWVDCQGYLTTKTTNPHCLFNYAPCDNKRSPSSFRKFVDQQGSGLSYFCNNSAHGLNSLTPQSGFSNAVNWSYGSKTVKYYNNVMHGMPVPGDQKGTVVAQYNLVTFASYSGSIGGTLNAGDFLGGTGKFDTTNVFNTNLASIYMDAANHDFRPKSALSPLLTTGTFSLTTILAEMKAAFPRVPDADWYLDPFGHAINYAALKLGADQSISYP